MDELSPRVARQQEEFRQRKADEKATRAEFARRRAYGLERRRAVKLARLRPAQSEQPE